LPSVRIVRIIILTAMRHSPSHANPRPPISLFPENPYHVAPYPIPPMNNRRFVLLVSLPLAL
jgi:hypothetical protein